MPTLTPSHTVAGLDTAAFAGGRGYLAACTAGLPPTAARDAVVADVEAAGTGRVDIAGYGRAVERSRAAFARLVGVDASRIAIGSQTSVLVSLIAASLPRGAEVLCPEGDFSSVMLPFAHAGHRVRTAPLAELAESVTARTALVAFSLVQSATGEVADPEAIVDAARAHGSRVLCDATQAVGWLPVDASRFDALVCHAYKWLCAPRGVAFLAVTEDFQRELRPVHAGWYAGADPWASCYGHDAELAADASRFDVSPAWQAFVGAAPALELFAGLEASALHDHATGLAQLFRRGLGLPEPERESAIVSWDDPDGSDLARLTAAGITASGRAGRARVAFHLFNDADDVARAIHALRCITVVR
ncbi:MAG TPA: aminotransferase class V-fold PLP-dependent enzyme [Microbacterium sp.]|nr:aminotransferase class V-fold PLP-dependent enzyme [Microbacterium sp.]